MPELWGAALAGLAAGGALLAGAIIGWLVHIPRRTVAAVMAFGAGVLISALAFDLVGKASAAGGLLVTVVGFLVGAVAYVGGNALLDRRNARNRKPLRGANPGTGVGIATGALLDGVPESAILGLSMLGGGTVSMPILAAVMISNLPESMSSSATLKASGRSARFVFILWGGIALVSVISAVTGLLVLQDAPREVTAFVTAVAAGAILAMICDTMIPEAFADAGPSTGLLATAGFLLSYSVHFLA